MARSVFRPIIFALKRSPTWPGTIIPYEPPEPMWVLESGIWRNVGYWFSDKASWSAPVSESSSTVYDGMQEGEFIGTLKYLFDLWDETGSENTSSPSVATQKFNEVSYYNSTPTLQDRMTGSDAMDAINNLLSILSAGDGENVLKSAINRQTLYSAINGETLRSAVI